MDRAPREVIPAASLFRGPRPEMARLYLGMNTPMDQLCATYDEAQLELLADFLRRIAEAGQGATQHLASV